VDNSVKCRTCEYAIEEELLFADGFDEAIIGCSTGVRTGLLIYDYEKAVEILMDEGSSEEDAIEHMEYNVVGGWVGEQTPIFVKRRCE